MDTLNCQPCNERHKQAMAVKWCTECEQMLCSECTENHQVQKMSRHHPLVEIDKIPQQFNIPSFCQKHECLKFEYFCIDHDTLCCKECLAESHRTCQKCMSIDVASVNSKGSQSYVDTIKHISHLLESLKMLGDNQKANLVCIETNASKIRIAIGNVKQRIIQHLDVLEELLLAKLDQIMNKYISQIKENVSFVDDISTETHEHKSAFNFINDNGTDKQAFLLVHSSKQILRNIEDKVNSLTKNVMEVNIRFNDNKLEKSMTALGSIETKETPYMVLLVPNKQRQSQIHVDTDQQLTFHHNINLKQNHDVGILGMTVTDNNLLLLCDYRLNKLRICDKSDTYISSIDLQYMPWDIAVIPSKSTAVVTSSLDPYIQFIDVKRKVKLHTINIPGSEHGGVSTTKDYIILGVERKIFILDHKGNTLGEIRPNVDSFSIYICYIFVGSNNLIYFTNGDELHCTTLRGKTVFSYKSPDLSKLKSVALDKRGNIYVVAQYSNSIHKLTPDGKFVEIILSVKDGLKEPLAICYNKDYTKLYIANESGSNVMVFKVN